MQKGSRLVRIVNEVRPLFQIKTLRPSKYDGYVGRNGNGQQTLFDGLENKEDYIKKIKMKNRRVLGDYYEYMTVGFYGGKLKERLSLFEDDIEPDVLNKKKKQAYDAKACGSSQQLKLNDNQVMKYIKMQYFNPDYSIYFAIYRHPLRNIDQYSKDEFIKEISNKTLYSVVIPLSLVIDLNMQRNNDLVYRYEGTRWTRTTSARSNILHMLFLGFPEDSETKILEISSINPENYELKRFMSPKNFSINGNKVAQFPIMFINDRDHEKWMDRFHQEYREYEYKEEDENLSKANYEKAPF